MKTENDYIWEKPRKKKLVLTLEKIESMKSMGKHQRYRLKNRFSGCCPHCGKPCAPYYECVDRRFYKKLLRTLYRLKEQGLIRQTADKKWCSNESKM